MEEGKEEEGGGVGGAWSCCCSSSSSSIRDSLSKVDFNMLLFSQSGSKNLFFKVN